MDQNDVGMAYGPQPFTKGKPWRFWALFPALMVTTMLSAVEATVVSTALPTIVHELEVGSNYVWIVNAFLLTSTGFLPVIGQLADAWGRRWLTIGSVAIFTIGSGIAGAANNGQVLIVGRAIQGLGSGGLNMLIDLVICDLVPLRERGKFIGQINAVFAIGLFAGPFIGGTIVEHASWRWVGHVKAPLAERLWRFDYIGNILVLGSATAILYALTYAGTLYDWKDGRILAPLLIGFVGMGVFHWYEASSLCKYPTIPPRLFGNRTSSIAFFLTFIHALMTVWTLYFLPVYFQAVQLVSPSRSGVHILPTVFGMLPAAIIAGQYLTRIGKYKVLHIVGMVLMTAGLGSFAAFDATSHTAMWVCLQLVTSLGNGIIATSLLPAVQAGLTDEDNAASTSTWSYIRMYGAIWGVTIPAAVFNNIFTKNLWIEDATAREVLANGNAYAYAAREFVLSFPETIQQNIVGVYTDVLRVSWIVAAAITSFAAVFTLFEVDIGLRESLRTEFGIKYQKQDGDGEGQENSKAPP